MPSPFDRRFQKPEPEEGLTPPENPESQPENTESDIISPSHSENSDAEPKSDAFGSASLFSELDGDVDPWLFDEDICTPRKQMAERPSHNQEEFAYTMTRRFRNHSKPRPPTTYSPPSPSLIYIDSDASTVSLYAECDAANISNTELINTQPVIDSDASTVSLYAESNAASNTQPTTSRGKKRSWDSEIAHSPTSPQAPASALI